MLACPERPYCGLLVAMAGGRCRTEQGDMRPSIHAVGAMIDRTESAFRADPAARGQHTWSRSVTGYRSGVWLHLARR